MTRSSAKVPVRSSPVAAVTSVVVFGALALSFVSCLGPGTLKEPCYASGEELIQARCNSCHSSMLTEAQRSKAPTGMDFDTPGDQRLHAARIRERAVVEGTMPPQAPLLDCNRQLLEEYLVKLESAPCQPACSGRDCGPDGCGGSCGSCAMGECDGDGQCFVPTCIPDCSGKQCGSDGCGGSCGTCASGLACVADGECACAPECTGRSCGPDGCGGSCGSCSASSNCSVTGACVCEPSCAGKECGDDGCGGSCGACPSGESCTAANACECVPDCAGRACGPDACGGSCGDCTGGLVCVTTTGTCAASCTPSCGSNVCGDDGCGGSCGTCASKQVCSGGQCACAPNCAGKACGPDGCGGQCGTCGPNLACDVAGQCVCAPNCAGRVCGPDGCGGSCGSCPSGTACGTDGQCACAPSCAGLVCGDDGCGGTCGTCSSGSTCSGGQCVWPAKSYATDIHPIWVRATCQSSNCHSGSRPSGGLDLSTAAIGYSEMVGVFSTQCTSKLLVAQGDLAASYLMNKLLGSGMCSGGQMPKSGVSLTPGELDAVRAWIGSGANP